MISVVSRGVVWENPKPYLRTRQGMHPTIVDLGDGKLFCAHDIGEAPEAMNYQTYGSRSLDGGETWALEDAILQEKTDRPTTSIVRVGKTPGGLVGFGARMYRDNPEEGLVNRDNLGYVPMDLIMVRSTDGGRSWSPPRTIEPPLVGPAFEVSHPVFEIDSGNWLAPVATWRGWDGSLPNGDKAIVMISRDQGQSFPEYGVVFDGTEDGLIHWEQNVVPLGGEKLFAVAWVYHVATGTNRPNRFTTSVDGGRTFAPPREVGIDGQTCKVCPLRDGRLLFTYRRTDKPGLWAQLASLDGDALTLEEPTPLWGTGVASSGMDGVDHQMDELSGLKFGFPQMVELESGQVMLVFWGFNEWSTRINYIRLQIDD